MLPSMLAPCLYFSQACITCELQVQACITWSIGGAGKLTSSDNPTTSSSSCFTMPVAVVPSSPRVCFGMPSPHRRRQLIILYHMYVSSSVTYAWAALLGPPTALLGLTPAVHYFYHFVCKPIALQVSTCCNMLLDTASRVLAGMNFTWLNVHVQQLAERLSQGLPAPNGMLDSHGKGKDM